MLSEVETTKFILEKKKNIHLSAKILAHSSSRLTFNLWILKVKVINSHFEKYFPSFFLAGHVNSTSLKLTCSLS